MADSLDPTGRDYEDAKPPAGRYRVGRVDGLAAGDGIYHGLVDDVVKGRYPILSITAASV